MDRVGAHQVVVERGLRHVSRNAKRWLCGVAVLCILAGSASVEAQVEPPDVAEVAQSIEAWTRNVLDTTGIPSISIALVHDNKVAWVGAFGWANVTAGTAATADTYFSTGSTFKSVTATAVMQLVERGLLHLDSALNVILGDGLAISGADDVTIRHLLSHQAGLEVPLQRVPLWGRERPLGLRETIAKSRSVGPPGREHRYCNGCYALLEYIIEEASGVPFDQYVAQNIFQPLGTDIPSASMPDGGMVERMALPYQVEDGTVRADGYVRYNSFAAGDAYLRPIDMARFLVTQLNGGVYGNTRLLAKSSVTEMQTEQLGGSGYGLGLMLRDLSGHRVIHHGGSVPGFKAVLLGDASCGCGVYVMSNATQAERAINLLAWYAMMLLWGEEVEPPSD